MVCFFGIITISVIIGYIISCRWEKSGYIFYKINVIMVSAVIGIVMGIGLSFWGGSFVKKEIVVEKYFILPIIFEGKNIAALMEEHEGILIESDDYVFQITKEGDETNSTKPIKHSLFQKDIFFNDDIGERYLEIKRSKTCRENMWVWFFYGGTGIIESKAVLKKGDNFLTLPRYYSL